jgi:TonB-dependent starch-binding outer membrane protein SusC
MPFKSNGLARLCCTAFFLFLSCSLLAQTAVTGKITSNTDHQPVAGATVQVKGTKFATQTNSLGEFSINAANNAVLVITVVGYETVTIPVSGRTSIGDIGLTQSTSSLNDVVVTGYTAQKKKDITGAVTVVNVNNMKSVPSGNTEALLQGQAAGVTVIGSGAPGGGINIFVRGVTTPGNTSPLVVIDGVYGDLSDMNVNDIESVQVLKDAGSTAIYGIQGANGVVIVTTKKGRQGKTRITYDGFYGTSIALPNGFNLANTQQYANVRWAQQLNSGIANPTNPQFGTGPTPKIPVYITPSGAAAGAPGTADSNYDINTNQITLANQQGTDWFHEIFKDAPIQSHTLTASGATDRTSYLFSIGYLDQQGTLINTYLKRYSVRMNTVFNVKEHIRVGENAYIFYKDNPSITNQNEGNAISNSYRIPPIIPVYDIMGNYAGTKSAGLSNAANPVAIQQRQANNKGNTWQVNGNVFAEVDFAKHFTIRTDFGGQFSNNYYYYFNYTPYENAEGNTTPNSFTEGSQYYSQWLWTNTLKYTQVFGKSNISVLVGTEAQEAYNRGLYASRTNYFSTDPNYWTLNTGAPSPQSNNNGSYGNAYAPTQSTIYSLFARADYIFDEKYLLSGTIRRDQASVFDPSNNTGYFPSVSGGWILSKEDFMRDASWLTFAKIRGSWGKSGNLSTVPATNPFNLYSSGAGHSYYDINGTGTSSVQGFYSSQIGNAATTWENDEMTDIGIDLSFKRFDLTVDWYNKQAKGLLFTPLLNNYLGGPTAPFVNFGNMQNIGWDGTLTYHGLISKDWKFDITGSFTQYTNKVVSLPPGINYYDVNSAGSTRIGAFTRMQPGQPIGEFFGYQEVGLFQSAADVAKSPTQQDAAPGRLKFADINHDGKITDSDRTFFGNPNPKFTYGLNLSVSYKQFDFSAFFYGSYGNQVLNYVRYWTDFPQVFEGNVSLDAVNNSWTPNNLNAKVPILETAANFSNSNTVNSYYMEPGSFFKAKQMQIGYTLSPALLAKAGIDRLRVYVQALNLFTVTKYTGLDPELQGSNLSDNRSFGVDFGNYPANQKSYLVGISLTF